jgi:hypothetical protein
MVIKEDLEHSFLALASVAALPELLGAANIIRASVFGR